MFLRVLFIAIICGKCWTLDNGVSAQTATTDFTMEELIREVKDMKLALNQMKLRDKLQEKQLTDMRETIAILKKENTEFKRKSAELHYRVRMLELNKEEEISALRKINLPSQVPREQNKRKEGLNQKSNSTGNQFIEQYSINPRKRLFDTNSINTVGCERNIGFTVNRYRDNMHLNVGQTIIFNEVISNIGGLYNANTGVFTIDAAGFYVFYVNVLCLRNRVTKTELVRDGTSLSIQICDGFGEAHDNGSSMTVIDLPVGASVWVRVRYVDSNDQDELGSETSFSGFLLTCI